MFTTNDVAKVYDTNMSIPGMNETMKIDMKISRRNVLLLNSVIKRGLSVKDESLIYRSFKTFIRFFSGMKIIIGSVLQILVFTLHYFNTGRNVNYVNPIQVHSYEIMRRAKTSASTTYHKCIRDSSDYGYINYESSFKRKQASKVYFNTR